MVCTVAVGDGLRVGVKGVSLVICILSSGAAVQLSAFHGDGVPRLSLLRRIYKIQNLHRAHCDFIGAGGARRPSMVAAAALDIYSLHLLEPLALHWSKFRLVDDVCATRGPGAFRK